MGGVALDAAVKRPLAETAIQALDPQRHASIDGSRHVVRLRHRCGSGAGREGRWHLLRADCSRSVRRDRSRSLPPRRHAFASTCGHRISSTCPATPMRKCTPSGDGCRIWGLTGNGTDPVNRKFTLEIDGKPIAAELFRRTPKALTITGYRLDTIRELTNIDKAFHWAIVWGERRKAAAAEAAAAAQLNGYGFNGGGTGHDIDRIEQIVREGPLGGNRSDTFHVVVGHYLGCDWSVERIYEHLQQFPNGIADKYIGEGRLRQEIDRSARKHAERTLPLIDGWKAPERKPAPPPPKPPPPEPAEDDELDEPDDSGDPDEQ